MYTAMRILHFLGAIFWIGGLVTSALAAAIGASGGKQVATAARATALRIGTPGMLAAWIGGLGMLVPLWSEVYARQPWMHAKLTFVFIAAALSGVISGSLRRAADSGEIPAGKLRGLALGVLAIGVLAVVLAVAKPGTGG